MGTAPHPRPSSVDRQLGLRDKAPSLCSPVLLVKTTGFQLCDPWWVPGPPLRVSFMSTHWPPVLPCRQDGADSKAGLVGPLGLRHLLSCHLSSAGHAPGLSPLLPACCCFLLKAGHAQRSPLPPLLCPRRSGQPFAAECVVIVCFYHGSDARAPAQA